MKFYKSRPSHERLTNTAIININLKEIIRFVLQCVHHLQVCMPKNLLNITNIDAGSCSIKKICFTASFPFNNNNKVFGYFGFFFSCARTYTVIYLCSFNTFMCAVINNIYLSSFSSCSMNIVRSHTFTY